MTHRPETKREPGKFVMYGRLDILNGEGGGMDLKNEILRRVDALPVDLQRRLLNYLDTLDQSFPHFPQGEKGSALVPFAGLLDDTSALEMSAAIDAACEGVDASEW